MLLFPSNRTGPSGVAFEEIEFLLDEGVFVLIAESFDLSQAQLGGELAQFRLEGVEPFEGPMT